MNCNQCGKKVSKTAMFCSNCGSLIFDDVTLDSKPKQRTNFEAVEDIKEKLRAIENRKKPPLQKGEVLKSILDIAKGEKNALDFVSGNSFEAKKIEDKKNLIFDYPIPDSPQALVNFTKYIDSEIKARKKEPDELTPVWKEKLKQVYLYAETEFSSTEELEEIRKCYKANKRRERHASIREFIVFLAFAIIPAFIVSLVFHWPLLLFASILAAGWEVFLILLVYDLLDDMVDSIKQHSARQQGVPKWLRSSAWHLLIPFLAALITSISYHFVGLIVIFAILFGVDAFFLLVFTCCIYD